MKPMILARAQVPDRARQKAARREEAVAVVARPERLPQELAPSHSAPRIPPRAASAPS